MNHDTQAQLRAWAADIEDLLTRDWGDREDAETLRAVAEGLLGLAGDEKADLV